jgi:hypothetical protein
MKLWSGADTDGLAGIAVQEEGEDDDGGGKDDQGIGDDYFEDFPTCAYEEVRPMIAADAPLSHKAVLGIPVKTPIVMHCLTAASQGGHDAGGSLRADQAGLRGRVPGGLHRS